MKNKKFLPRLKNKRADLSVLVFVFLVLFLCGYTLFVLLSSKTKVESRLFGYEISEKLLLEQKGLEYRMAKLGEECIILSFGPQATYYDHSEWILERSGENFTKIIRECIAEKSVTIRDSLDRNKFITTYGLYSRISAGINLMVDSNEESVFITLKNFPVSLTEDLVIYKPDLISTISLNRLGLINPSEFGKIVECGQDENCRQLLTHDLFEVELESTIVGDQEHTIYTFTSRKEFSIGNSFKKIIFYFFV